MRYVPEAHAFFLWGFMNDDPELLQEQPLMRPPEYDMVVFDPAIAKWRNEFPATWAQQWSKRLPLAYVTRTYSGITTGSERTVVRSATDDAEAAPRPDLNVVFDQVVHVPSLHALVYFTGGTTAAYDVESRRWKDLAPRHAPPPVLGGSLAYDSVHEEVLLFGGGHVAERASDGTPRGYTGTWSYDPQANDWRELKTTAQPPPRMNTRMVTDTRNNVVVLFGGDGQSHYLADTWIFDLKTRSWHASKAAAVPEARAGHFAVYDSESGRVIIGGGYHRADLTDMWAYDAREDRWTRLAGDVPTGFYLTADIAPERRLLVLATSNRAPGDRMSCNVLFPVRTTYMYRLEGEPVGVNQGAQSHAIAKRAPESDREGSRIAWNALPRNRWVLLGGSGRNAPTRTWGSATFDTDRERILYWGGGHCGYGGSDVDTYDVARNTWRSSDDAPEYPERLWNHGVREAGITFGGRPWMEHGRRTYAYDPVSRRMVIVRRLRLTGGYDAPLARDAPSSDNVAPDALVRPGSSYVRFVTWTFAADSSKWDLAGNAPRGVDTLVSTPHGVVGIDVDWPSKLNDAGYQRSWTSASPRRAAAVYMYSVASRSWKRLDDPAGDSPQNLYEMTSLAYDSRRDRLILHGGGASRDELWTFDMRSRQWQNMRPRTSGAAPACSREAVYLPKEDIFLTYGNGVRTWSVSENAWHVVQIPFDVEPASAVGQNRALVYDPKRDVVFLVLGAGGDDGLAQVYALRYADHE
jgi:N-acetylneuraminic acid mutarotase